MKYSGEESAVAYAMQPKKSSPNLPASLRTDNSEAAYQEAKKLGLTGSLLDEPILIEYDLWVVVSNRFPYDMAYEVHDLLLPRREVANRRDLTVAELVECNKILDELSTTYQVILENMPNTRSIQSHYHLHLARYYPKREQFKR